MIPFFVFYLFVLGFFLAPGPQEDASLSSVRSTNSISLIPVVGA